MSRDCMGLRDETCIDRYDPVLPEAFVGFLLIAVVGIMIYISFDTLLPLSHEYGDWHYAIAGVMSGIIIIWASLLLVNGY